MSNAETPPPSPSPHRGGSWVSWVVIGLSLATTLIGIAFVSANHRFQAARIEAELQLLQLQVLERSLESETLISDETLALLQRAETGESLSAIAILSAELANGVEVIANVVWSDSNGAGHLVLPAELVKRIPAARVRISGRLEGSDKRVLLSPVQADHPRIIGFRQTPVEGQLQSLEISFVAVDEAVAPVVLAGEFTR